MITKLLLDLLCAIPNALLSVMGVFSIDIALPPEAQQGLRSIMGSLFYIFPVAGLLPILMTMTTLRFIRVAWAIILRIKSFIPTMGS